jgi:hypothetical protein
MAVLDCCGTFLHEQCYVGGWLLRVYLMRVPGVVGVTRSDRHGFRGRWPGSAVVMKCLEFGGCSRVRRGTAEPWMTS